MKEYFDIIQRSKEWFDLKKDRISASQAQAIGNCGKGLETYIIEKMSAYYSDAEVETYSNADMERGNELENQAAMIYEFEFGVDTKKCGFVAYNDYVGCSPDLFVDNNGLAEIKCPNDKNYFKLLLDFKIDSKYIWQMQCQMLCCNRSWCDFVAYNLNFEKSILVKRVYPDQKYVSALLKGFKIGEKLIKEITEKMTK